MRLLFTFLLAFGLSLSANARADDDPREAARAHYEQGLALANRGAYAAALREFRAAYEKSPNFSVLYNIGQAEIAMGRPLEAIQALSHYLRDGKERIPEARRKQVEAQIALVESLLAEVVVTSDVPGALVSVDGRELGTTPLAEPLRVTAGPHEVSLTFPGFSPVKRSVALREGERRVLHFEHASAGAPKVAPPAPAPVCPAAAPARCPPPVVIEREARGAKTTLGLVLTGTGIALAASAVGHYFWNRGRYDDWSAEQEALDPERGAAGYAERQAANNALAQSIDSASAVTVSLALAGAAFVGGGVVLIVTDGKRAERDHSRASQQRMPGLRVSVAPASLALSGAF